MNNLKSLRKENKLTVLEVANLTNLDPSFITKIENGNRGFSIATAKKLASVYNTTIEEIINPSSLNEFDISSMRTAIDKIDKEMALLFTKRMDIVKSISIYKKNNALPVLDKSREKAILEKNITYIDNKEYQKYYLDFYQEILRLSKEYQMKNTNS